MSEVRCYALAIPTDEMWCYWMKRNDDTFKNLEGIVGIHPTDDAQYLLFKDKRDWTHAYRKIHNVYPDSLCGYVTRMIYIDERYIKQKEA